MIGRSVMVIMMSIKSVDLELPTEWSKFAFC